MAARQIPQYTEKQLSREIERVGAKPRGDCTTPEGREAFDNSYAYFSELLAEDERRKPLRGQAPAFGGWTVDLPVGKILRQERVA